VEKKMNVLMRNQGTMRNTVLFLVCAATIFFGLLIPAVGLSQSLDQQLVIDDAKIFQGRIGSVEAAAGKLASQGADIRVRTIATYGSAGNLDQYEAQLEKQSPSWIDQDGNRKNNLIVLLISVQERQTGLYYGSYWEGKIGSNWLTIQTDTMNPLFRSGDYAGGTIKGLEEISGLIQGTGQPQTGSQGGTGSSLWWIILLVIVVLVVGVLLFSNYRKNKAKWLAARQKAMLAKQGAASGINELNDAVQMLEIKVNVTAGKLVSGEAATLMDGLEKAKRLVDLSAQTYGELSHSAGDPENPKLGVSELEVIETEYQKILASLRQARESIKGVEDQVAAVQQAIDGFPGMVAEVNTGIEEALRKQEELQKAGFKTAYPADLVAKGRTILEQAKTLVAERQFLEGMKNVNLAADQIKLAFQAAEELPRKKQEAEAVIPALASRIEQVKELVNNSRDAFMRISQGYAEATWDSVRGNGTEAENRIDWALDAHNDALSAIGIEQQAYHQALELVYKGNSWLTEAESFMRSISELEASLKAERESAPNEIDAAQADVSKAWEYINRYDEDIRESLEEDLRSAEKKNNLAREELKKDKPDYFMVNKLAREANESADKILIQARDEHETADRLRAKAVSGRRDASAKVSIATEYVEDHHAVVNNEARSYLKKAVEALRQADSAADLNSQISLVSQAESAADQAYSLAQSDVANSWEGPRSTSDMPDLRIPEIILSTILFPPTGGSSRGNSPWGSRRGGSSSSGPTIRPGGGGSTSWGSGGGRARGGGGSTGW
jgi:uncharacterized membrane protein YgcG